MKLLAELDPENHPLAELILDGVGQGRVSPADVEFSPLPARPSVAILIRGLKSHNEDVRTTAAYALADLAFDLQVKEEENAGDNKPGKAEAEEARTGQILRNQIVDALLSLLVDPDTEVRWASAWSLGTYVLTGEDPQPKVLSALTKLVRDKSTRIREGAWIRFAEGSFDEGLSDHTARNAAGEKLRIAGLQAMIAFGENAVEAVPDLVDALNDNDPFVRWYATRMVGSVGREAKEAVPILIRLLDSKIKMPRIRYQSLLDSGRESQETLQLMAATALGAIGPEARAAIPSLIRALDAHDSSLRLAVAEALGQIGSADPAVIPALSRAMTSSVHNDLADHAATALGSLGEAAIPALIRGIHEHDPEVRVRAAQALSRMGPAAKGALPELEKSADDHDPDARQAIENAVKQIRQGATEPDPDSGAALP
jgi:HEAT repeat protein